MTVANIARASAAAGLMLAMAPMAAMADDDDAGANSGADVFAQLRSDIAKENVEVAIKGVDVTSGANALGDAVDSAKDPAPSPTLDGAVDAKLDATASVGGVEIALPSSWSVSELEIGDALHAGYAVDEDDSTAVVVFSGDLESLGAWDSWDVADVLMDSYSIDGRMTDQSPEETSFTGYGADGLYSYGKAVADSEMFVAAIALVDENGDSALAERIVDGIALTETDGVPYYILAADEPFEAGGVKFDALVVVAGIAAPVSAEWDMEVYDGSIAVYDPETFSSLVVATVDSQQDVEFVDKLLEGDDDAVAELEASDVTLLSTKDGIAVCKVTEYMYVAVARADAGVAAVSVMAEDVDVAAAIASGVFAVDGADLDGVEQAGVVTDADFSAYVDETFSLDFDFDLDLDEDLNEIDFDEGSDSDLSDLIESKPRLMKNA